MICTRMTTRGRSVCIFAGILTLILYAYLIYISNRRDTPHLFQHNRSETIHVCTVVIGGLRIPHMLTCLKSLQYFNGAIRASTGKCQPRRAANICYTPLRLQRSPIHLHILTDKQTQKSLKSALQNAILQEINVSLYLMDEHKHIVSWIPNWHPSGISALYKLLIPELLRNRTKKVIAFDIDTVFNDDILQLWKEFDCFNSKQAIGAVRELYPPNFQDLEDSTSTVRITNRTVRKSPNHTKDGNCLPVEDGMDPPPTINSGLIMWHLEHMKYTDWSALRIKSTWRILHIQGHLTNSDQGVINAVLSKNAHLYYELPCIWNVQVWHPKAHQYCSVVWPDRQAEVEYCEDLKRNGVRNKIPALVHFNTSPKPSINGSRPIRNVTLSRTQGYLSSMCTWCRQAQQ